MCAGPEIAALIAAATEATAAAAPEVAAGIGAAEAGTVAGTAAASPEFGMLASMSAAPGVLAPGQAMAGTLESAMINNGMGGAASGLNGLFGGAASKNAQGLMTAKQGIDMMQPQRPPQQQGGMIPHQQPQPLPTPYGPGGNSTGMQMPRGMPMSEEQKRRLRAMGYPV